MGMLILTRGRDEEVVLTLPDKRRIRIVVVKVADGQVRLGVEAPKDVVIHREEIQARIDAGEDQRR